MVLRRFAEMAFDVAGNLHAYGDSSGKLTASSQRRIHHHVNFVLHQAWSAPQTGVSFLEDANGKWQPMTAGDRPLLFRTSLAPAGPGSSAISAWVGDWTGDGHAQGRCLPAGHRSMVSSMPTTTGIFDAGDLTYSFGGLTGDKPFVGDWNGPG